MTAEEQVLLFSISKWIKKNVEEKEGMNLLQKIYGEIEQKAFTADEIYTDQWDGQKVYGLVCLGDIFDIFQNHTKDFSADTYYGSGDEKSILCTVDKDGVLSLYDDTYDVVIHCLSKEDQEQTVKLIKDSNWVPVEERLPETDDYILISFDNTSIVDIGRYEKDEDGGGAFYPGDEDKSYSSIGIFVNAWRPLPESYRRESENDEM